MNRKAYAMLVFVMLCIGSTLYSIQLRIDMDKGDEAAAEEFLQLPKAEYIKVASLGYEQMVADVLWLKAVQYIGAREVSSKGYDWIYAACDTITTLDPKFLEPYEYGGLILTVVADSADLSTKLLEKGSGNRPDIWQLHYYLGFNQFFYFKDYAAAARNMEAAAKIKGSPPWIPLLVSRLYVQSENPEYSLQFLQGMYESTKDEKIRAELISRANAIKSLVVAGGIQKVVDAYTAKYGRRPASLRQMVSEGVITELPDDPNGGHFYMDKDGKVKSSNAPANLGIYRKRW